MEYRKLISFGKNSFVISIPKPWVRQHKLKKGDVIYVDETNNNLILHPNYEDKEDDKEIVIPINGKSLKHIHREIIAAYVHNYKRIKLIGSDIKDKATKIQEMIQKLVALEIVEQDSKKIIATDFLNVKDISLEQMTKKMAVISKSMLCDCKNMFNEDTYSSIYLRDKDINKFRFLVYRIVWYGLENPSAALKLFKLNQMGLFNNWWLSFSIEQIGDCIKRISRPMQSIKLSRKDKEEFVKLLTKIEADYHAVLNAYYKQDLEVSYKVVDNRANLMEEIEKFFKKNQEIASIGELTYNTKGLVVHINAIARIIYQGMICE